MSWETGCAPYGRLTCLRVPACVPVCVSAQAGPRGQAHRQEVLQARRRET